MLTCIQVIALCCFLCLPSFSASQSFDFDWFSLTDFLGTKSYNPSASRPSWETTSTFFQFVKSSNNSFSYTHTTGSGNYKGSSYYSSYFSSPINLSLIDNDYVLYWKVTLIVNLSSSNPSVVRPVYYSHSSNIIPSGTFASLSFSSSSSNLSNELVLQLSEFTDDFAVFTYFVTIDELYALKSLTLNTCFQTLANSTYPLSATVSVSVPVFTVVPVNEADYEAWQSSQRIEDGLFGENESQQSAVDGLESSAGAFQGALDDYSDLNDQIYRPSEGDIDMDFDSITGGLFDDNFVDYTFGVFYSSPMVITLMLSCVSFAILGFIMFGRRT